MKHVSIDDIYVDQGIVSIQVAVPRTAFDRVVIPSLSDEGIGAVVYARCWAEHPVEGDITSDPALRWLAAPSGKGEAREDFASRAREEGWSGSVFACPACDAINPCGVRI